MRLLNPIRGLLPRLTIRCYSTTSPEVLLYDKDPAPKFLRPDVQALLVSVTQMDIEKVLYKQNLNENQVKYEFMTTEKVERLRRQGEALARKFIQPPPIVRIREDRQEIIAKDKSLDQHNDVPIIFTDISFDLTNSERPIVVRQPDGTLEHASQELRKQMNQIYFPQPYRLLRTPALFEPDNFRSVLARHEYVFVLDRICQQFEPDERTFHELTSQTFLHINDEKQFNNLRSTRYFGMMMFFLAWHGIIEDLLLDCISRGLIQNATEVLLCRYILADKDTQAKELKETLKNAQNDFDMINALVKYVKEDAVKKVQLELALQAAIESKAAAKN